MVNIGNVSRIGNGFEFRLECDESSEGITSPDIYTCDDGQWKLGDNYTEPCASAVTALPITSSTTTTTTAAAATTTKTPDNKNNNNKGW